MRIEVVALVVGGLAAFAALLNVAVALYSTWLDNRGFVIRLRPLRAGHGSTGSGIYRVFFIVEFSAFNPARTRNTLLRLEAWRDGQEVSCLWLPTRKPFAPTVIEPFDTLAGEVLVEAFNPTTNIQQAYDSVLQIRIEVEPARGRRTAFSFERVKFPLQ